MINITEGSIAHVRTIVTRDGKPIHDDEPVYQWMREHSPMQRGDMIQRHLLDQYTERLNRYPRSRIRRRGQRVHWERRMPLSLAEKSPPAGRG